MKWTKTNLSKLRDEIPLGSIYTHDYKNTFHVEIHSCQNFFDSFADYIGELMIEDGCDADQYWNMIDKYDTADNLWNWYNCYENDPFIYVEED